MAQQTELALPELYAEDEVAWYDAMVELLDAGDYASLDYASLKELLTDMSIRERREVGSRLAVLLAHILKWTHQTERRSRSWAGTILEQRYELAEIAGRGVLRNHALATLPKAYRRAVDQATTETGLPPDTFPAECGYTLAEVLAFVPDTAGL